MESYAGAPTYDSSPVSPFPPSFLLLSSDNKYVGVCIPDCPVMPRSALPAYSLCVLSRCSTLPNGDRCGCSPAAVQDFFLAKHEQGERGKKG